LAVVIISVVYVCMSVCQTISFESLDIRTLFSLIRWIFMGVRLKFVYEGHRIKVTITRAKIHERLFRHPLGLSENWEHNYNCRDSELTASPRGGEQTWPWEIPCVISVLHYHHHHQFNTHECSM